MEDEPGGHPGGHQQEVPHDGQWREDAEMEKNQNFSLNIIIYNKHFESSQKLLKSSFVNEIFKKIQFKIQIFIITFSNK